MEFSNKNILILGLGVSNLAVIDYLKDKKIGRLTVTDLKDETSLGEIVRQAKKIFPGAKFVLGRHEEADFLRADLIIKSPSIFASVPLVQKATTKGVPVESDVSLFFKLSPSKKVIGVTGTKGKTTTATFLAQVLEEQGEHTILAGNMGIPVMSQLSRVTEDSWVVLELSSYMLESLEAYCVSPRVAVYTNIFPDHLDKYKSFDNYVTSKKGLYRYQGENDITLFFAFCPTLKKLRPEVVSRLVCYSRNDLPKDIKLKITGGHNRDNLAAGFVLARELKIDIGRVAKVAERFAGLEHRMENLGKIDKREFINNSAATNPGAFVVDLESLKERRKNIYLIAGGSDKGLNTKEISDLINRTPLVKRVAFFEGGGTDRILEAVTREKSLGVFNTMSQAFNAILRVSETDSIIFLNPGCASFGVFQDEFDRGRQFKEQFENELSKH